MGLIATGNVQLDHIFDIVSNDPSRALKYCDKFLQNDPSNETALRYKFYAQDELGDMAGALETANRSINVNPKDDLAHLHVAETSYALGNYDDVIEHGKKAIELDDDESLGNIPHRLIALGYAHIGDLAGALHYANVAEDVDPGEWGTPNERIMAGSKSDFIARLHRLAAQKS